jgi:flagellar protein FlaJ
MPSDDTFQRMDIDRRDIVRTMRVPGSESGTDDQPHIMRMESGVVPTYVRTSPYHMFCWKYMGSYVRKKAKPNQKLEEDLLKAHIRVRPEEYVAFVWMTSIFAVIASAVLGVLLMVLLFPVGILIGLIMIFMLPVMAYVVLMAMPGSKAKARGKDIDQRISSVMAFISAMASADVNVDVIFRELAKQTVYGEIKNEAAWITRDTELLGVDILTALRKASQRTPSTKFQDFLQGVVTTSTSGGQLKPYFLLKADQFEKEAKLELRKKIETLGMLAETFAVVVVAFPLFLVVILAIMVLVQTNPAMLMQIFWAVVAVLIPIFQFVFIFFIWDMSKEV